MKLSLEHRHRLEHDLYLGHHNHRCSYLPDRMASLLYLDGHIDPVLYRQLLDAGYRRSGLGLYRPDCGGCRECRVLRLQVDQFRMTESQKRIWKKGQQQFQFTIERPSYDPKKLRLYQRYLQYQHGAYESDLDEHGYREFFVSSFLKDCTRELSLFRDNRLVGLGIIDIVDDVLSSVYFYFDPDAARLSPGTYSMLLEIEMAGAMGLQYYYPGYYIANCSAMNYKARYRPAEIMTEEGFAPLLK